MRGGHARVGQTVEVRDREGEWMIVMLDGLYLHLLRVDKDANEIRVAESQVREVWPDATPTERLARGAA